MLWTSRWRVGPLPAFPIKLDLAVAVAAATAAAEVAAASCLAAMSAARLALASATVEPIADRDPAPPRAMLALACATVGIVGIDEAATVALASGNNPIALSSSCSAMVDTAEPAKFVATIVGCSSGGTTAAPPVIRTKTARAFRVSSEASSGKWSEVTIVDPEAMLEGDCTFWFAHPILRGRPPKIFPAMVRMARWEILGSRKVKNA
mmetsp:Transcript_20707/g.46962  ORF Transcript_20707/g.46962 Transcript_20707/m.46962 type:complete len:207 (-) Transcript_20707:365-985(-)